MSVAQATSTQQILIGGEWRDAASGREFAQTFPYTGDQVGTFTELRWITVQEQPREYPI